MFLVIVVLMIVLGFGIGKIGSDKDDIQMVCGGFLLIAFAFIAILANQI